MPKFEAKREICKNLAKTGGLHPPPSPAPPAPPPMHCGELRRALPKIKDKKNQTYTKSLFLCSGLGTFLQFKLITFLADDLALQAFSEHSLMMRPLFTWQFSDASFG